MRFMIAHLWRKMGHFIRRNIGRVRHDQVKVAGYRLPPAALGKACAGLKPMARGIAQRHLQGSGRDVGAQTGGVRHRQQAGNQDATSAGAKVEHPGEGLRDRRLDQHFRIGPWVQRVRRNLEHMTPEQPRAQNLRHGLAAGAGGHKRDEGGFGLGGQGVLQMQAQPIRRQVHGAGEQQAGIAGGILDPGGPQDGQGGAQSLRPQAGCHCASASFSA